MESNEDPNISFFARQHEVCMAEMRRKFNETPPLTRDGMPTSQLAYYTIYQFFESHDKDISLEDEAVIKAMPEDLLGIMFRQLKEMDLITETAPGKFRYNLNCKDYQFQANVEKWLLDFYDLAPGVSTRCGSIYVPLSYHDSKPYYPGDNPPPNVIFSRF